MARCQASATSCSSTHKSQATSPRLAPAAASRPATASSTSRRDPRQPDDTTYSSVMLTNPFPCASRGERGPARPGVAARASPQERPHQMRPRGVPVRKGRGTALATEARRVHDRAQLSDRQLAAATPGARLSTVARLGSAVAAPSGARRPTRRARRDGRSTRAGHASRLHGENTIFQATMTIPQRRAGAGYRELPNQAPRGRRPPRTGWRASLTRATVRCSDSRRHAGDPPPDARQFCLSGESRSEGSY